MIRVSVDQKKFTELIARLDEEVDGKRLKRELARNLRIAVRPAVEKVKAGAMEIKRGTSDATRPSKKNPVEDSAVSLGAAIARGIGVSVRTRNKSASVTIRAKKAGMPRGFINAPKRINAKSFRHPVYGRGGWAVQVGKPGFFDDPLSHGRREYREACIRAMKDMANRIAK